MRFDEKVKKSKVVQELTGEVLWLFVQKENVEYIMIVTQLNSSMATWPNGKALDYESRDSRFDPWRGQISFGFSFCLKGIHAIHSLHSI